MLFITGPLYSGKRTFANPFGGRQIYEVQTLAANAESLPALADELAQYDVVTATEVGGGVVPIDPAQRAAREAAGRLACLLAERADVLQPAHRAERGAAAMLIYLLRHGLTQENLEKRYQGRRDVPLCPQGLAQLCRADFAPKTVMITSLQRTRQTAEVLFPDAELVVADGLKEMDFGVFEGRNYREMEHDPQYRAWVETGCEGRCPGGESKAEFCQRVCTAFAALVDAALAAGEPQLVIVAHGGTQMAALERFAVPHKNYYSWCAPAAGGFVLDAADWVHQKTLRVVKTVQYTKELPC